MKRFLFLGVLLMALVAVFFIRRPTIETSLFALVGEGEIKMHSEVLERGSGEIQVLFLAPSKEEALPVAEAFAASLPQAAFKAIRFKFGEETKQAQALFDFYQQYATGLLTSEDVKLLNDGAFRRLRTNAIRQWHKMLPTQYSPETDPFFFLNRFVTSRSRSMSGWQADLMDEVLTTKTETGIALLISLSLKDDIATNLDALMPVVNQLKRIAKDVEKNPVEISISGIPLHTVEIAGKCKKEISVLSFFSLFVILLTAWLAFKSFRVYPYFLFILLVSGGMGALVTMLCCSSIHLLSGVFATTLLGLTIDYAFHGRLAKHKGHLSKNLFCSWITTELSLLPLLFSGMPILEQSAIFMMTGLATAFFAVLITFNVTNEQEMVTSQWRVSRMRIIPMVLFLVLLPCLAWVHFGTDIQAFHAPSQTLIEAEKRFRDLTFPKLVEGNIGMLVIEGQTLEAVLEREARLSLPVTAPRASSFLPPLEQRQCAYEKLQALYAQEGASLVESLGLESLPQLCMPEPWTKENVPALLFDNFFIPQATGGYLTVIPNVPRPAVLGEGVYHYNPQHIMQQTVDHLSDLTQRLLLIVGLVLVVVLGIIFRGRAWKIALPSLLSVGVVFVLFGTGSRTLNLFHLLACFMLIGMSLDYTIFFASEDRSCWKPVTCSFITSLAGFGALALVSFMVVRSIGQVFAVGLTISYLSAFCLFGGHKDPSQTEVAASPIGLRLMLLGYRLFGKRFLDVMGYLFAQILWISSPKIRRFTASRRRLMAFIQATIDKFVVMSCGRGQPRVEAETDEETKALIADVAARKGVFLLTSHFGAIEVFPAISTTEVPLHAFMHIQQTAVFNRFYFDHFKRSSIHIHPVAGFGMGELFEAGAYIDQGDCILMAGDRAFGSSQTVTFLNRQAQFPKGVYRFAKLLEHPIYFVACYRVGYQHYRFVARKIMPNDQMVDQFIHALEPLVKAYPDQWYNWEMLQ